MSEKENKPPFWWPMNPYPPEIFPLNIEDIRELIPDKELRTRVAGCLCRHFWQIASEEIFRAYKNNR